MAVMIASVIAILCGLALITLVLVSIIRATQGRPVTERTAARLELVAGWLGIAFGVFLALSAWLELRATPPGGLTAWLSLVLGLGLALGNGLLLLARRYNVGLFGRQLALPSPDTETTPEEAIRAALARGNKIEAIRLYRAATGAGLAEAKRAVEGIAAQSDDSTGR